MGGTIYYVGEFSFPQGEAASYRVLGNALALQAAGCSVKVLGREGPESERGAGYRSPTHHGVPYESVNEYGLRSAFRWYRIWRFLRGGTRLVRWLTMHARHDASAIILAGGYSRYLFRLLPLVRRWRIPLVVDVVEWFEPNHCLGGALGPQRWDVELAMRVLIPLGSGVIAISAFLEKHFLANKCAVLRVPPLVDATGEKWKLATQRVDNSRLRLAFVGNAGQKDLVVNAIRGLALLGAQARECELTLVGPSKGELRASLGRECGLLEALSGSLSFAGRLPHAEALQRLAQADFSIILRPDQRFAHAGFPTKLVESMAMGVPVLCNLTSDIGLYVKNGQEGIVVPDCSPTAFAAGLRRAMALPREQRQAMRTSARRQAEVSFDYRNWSEPLGAFMRQVIAQNQGVRR